LVAMPRLLIINCASPYFFYIPMGSFGLCDFLARQGIEARIFSPSLYAEAEVGARLVEVLEQEKPSHVGLVCHWQETAHGLFDALALVRAWSREVVTLAGGFTASFFGEDLLRTLPGLDYVVTGDPEQPLLELLLGKDPRTVANLVRREAGQVVLNDQRWLMDARTLDTMAFGELNFLIDSGRYIDRINTRLGFPLMLGRGCVFDCAYCGGSRHAFGLHSGRRQPVVRSLAAVLADLHRLVSQTRILYLCYENDQAIIKALFRAIAKDRRLRGHFTLHYGAWHLLDRTFLELYREAFDCTTLAPIFEFSPEVVDDLKRAAIKRGRTYSLADLEENCADIATFFSGKVRIEVFFSRYHPALDREELHRDLGDLLCFKQRMVLAALPVHSCFDHLSTDVASRYWQENPLAPRSFADFLEQKHRLDQGDCYPFAVDNLCLLIPKQLPPDVVHDFEALVGALERLERYGHELVHILSTWYGRGWLDSLRQVVRALRQQVGDVFFSDPPMDRLVEGLGTALAADTNLSPPPFLADLIRFTRIKMQLEAKALPAAPEAEAARSGFYRLNPERISIHEQDYPDLRNLLIRLRHPGSDRIPYQRTVCLFGADGILTLPHALYRKVLRPFEHPCSLEQQLLCTDPSGQKLIVQLIQERVLVATSCD
jgi:hypothetical protein